MKVIAVLLSLMIHEAQAQGLTIDFYGDKFDLPALSSAESDSLSAGNGMPVRIKMFISKCRVVDSLSDWALVFFLVDVIDAEFSDRAESEKVRAMTSLLTDLGINNSIANTPGKELVSLVSINNKEHPINEQYVLNYGRVRNRRALSKIF